MFRVLPLIMTLAVSACSKGVPAAASANATVKPAEQTAQAAAVKPVPAQLPDVVARVNGETINKIEFETAIKNLEGRAGGPVPADQRDRVFRGVLDQLIAYRLLTHESRSRSVVVPEAEVEARLSQIRQQFPSEDAFKQTLAQQGMTLDKLRDDARSDMRVSKMLQDEVATKVAVQAGEVNDFYEKNPDKFKQGERVRASHILFRVPENANAAAKEQAKSKAADVLKQVKSGQDFAQLATTHSQDPGSAPGGGDLGYLMQGQMVGAFERAAFGLKPGEVSELVETPFGFHIIKVADKQAARTTPIDEVRPQIEQFLQNQRRMEKTQAFVDTLKAKGKVEIFI